MDHPARTCRGCLHFYVTWSWPHTRGCRAYGFKSVREPLLEVQDASGEDCRQRTPAAARGERTGPRGHHDSTQPSLATPPMREDAGHRRLY